ncbi:chemotaxis protein CheW [Bosea sp. UC22_33]|uniref:chemotaxis protein CheW n=1 Tax=Bosea sp. UC22_33 TaxID=3350165 RepID=UPI00366FD970
MSAETDSMTPDDIEECWREIGVSGDRSCPKLDDHLHCRNCPTHAQIARKLLDRPLPPGYRDEWTQHFAGRDEKAPEGEEIDSVLIFRIGEEWLGLPAAICREIAEPRPVHSLPHRRSEAVRGIVNVRGELLICISLPALLGIGGASASRSAERIAIFPRLVVTGEDSRHVAFEVDEVHGLHAYRAHERGAVPATVGRSAASVVATMIPWNGRAVGCLDAGRLLDLIDRSIA